jgi:glycosyltransferase involved in cell wall biosynthesis
MEKRRTAQMNIEKRRLALFLPSLRGGGAERVMVNLARGFVERGIAVDLVLAKAEGTYLSEVPQEVRIIDLKSHRVLTSLPGLIRYLRRERPSVLLSAMNHTNLVALWAKKLSGVSTKVVVSVHNNLKISSQNAPSWLGRILPWGIRLFYPWAERVIAVSQGVAESIVTITSVPREKITVIYNPVVTPDLFEKAKESVEHPWFHPKEHPIVISVGRLAKQKDYPTLLQAFYLVRKKIQTRLLILGEGEERPLLEKLIDELNLKEWVDLPGFVQNPYAYMARSDVFVLSSAWEGLPTVLIEAMACGCPVVSTDCPSGPAEILENGKWGKLVPVEDVEVLAGSILATLERNNKFDVLKRAIDFNLTNAVESYLNVMFGKVDNK